MLRAIAPFIIALTILSCACGREGIDAADRDATLAFEQFMKTQMRLTELLPTATRMICETVPEEPVFCQEIKQTSLPDADRVDPTDERVFREQERAVRTAMSRLRRLLLLSDRHPRLKEGPTHRALLEDIDRALSGVETTRDRYFDAAMTYNRALRTFPESVTNNMFLRFEQRILPQIDRQNPSKREKKRR